MPKTLSAFVPVLALVAMTPAVAAPAKKPVPVKSAEKFTCREFLALDDQFKPTAVSFVLGYDKAKRPEAKDVDVAGVDRVVPVIISTCRARPTQTLLKRIRNGLQPPLTYPSPLRPPGVCGAAEEAKNHAGKSGNNCASPPATVARPGRSPAHSASWSPPLAGAVRLACLDKEPETFMKITLALLATVAALAATPAFAQDDTPFAGAHIGIEGGWGRVGGSRIGSDGFVYGVNGGYDLALSNVRIGPELEITGSTQKTCITLPVPGPAQRNCQRTDRDLYVGGRLGYVVNPSVLIYAKVGYTNGRFNDRFESDGPVVPPSFHRDHDGVRVGGGLEYAPVAANLPDGRISLFAL